MQIVRPASGFIVHERPLVLETLSSMTPHCMWLQLAYSNIKERLRMTGHKTGHAIGDDITRRVFIDADPDSGVTRLVVSYVVLGDRLTIYALKVLASITPPAANTPSTPG